MDFVWQYVDNESFHYKSGMFYELDYSIRSVRKNCPGARCFVVGDNVDLDVIHIPAPPKVTQHKQPRAVDQYNKMQAIVKSNIGNEFVLMYDDVFIMKPTTEKELKVVYGNAIIESIDTYVSARNNSGGSVRKGTNSYRRLWRDTYYAFIFGRMQRGLKTYDWETHLPRVFEKEKMREVLKFDCVANPMLIISLYFGRYAETSKVIPEGLQSDLWTHKPGMDFDKLLDVKYLNIYDDVIVPDFIDKMKELFP